MDNNECSTLVEAFENKVRESLESYLRQTGALDEVVPVCPDVEQMWGGIAQTYLPDGAREFNAYPVVSLGWMMFVGMAVAYYWDTDWERYADDPDIYPRLRDMRGYDNMDEAVVEDLLGYTGEAAEKVSGLVAACGARVNALLMREHVEPGTEEAFGCYIAALRQLYLAGMAVELNALGYHMTPLQQN